MTNLGKQMEAHYGPTWYEDLLKDFIHLQHHTLIQEHLPEDCITALERLLILLEYIHTQKR